MRELLVAGLLERDYVADRRDARNVGPVLRVDAHVTAIQLQARFLSAESARDRPASRRDEKELGAQFLRLAVRSLRLEIDSVGARLRAGDLRAGHDLDALLLERALELCRDRLVFDRHEPRQQLDDRDVAAEAAEDRGELNADGTAADDDDRLRDRLQVDGFVARDDALPIDLDPRHAARLRSGRNDDFLLHRERLLLPLGDFDLALAGEPSGSLDPIDLVLLEEKLDPAGQTFHDLVLASLDLVHVDPGGSFAEGKPPLFPVLRDLQRVCMLEQRLRRDASPVETGSAKDRRAFDDGGLESQLRGADRGDVAAGPRTDDGDIVLVGH